MAARVIDAAVDLPVKMLQKMPEDHRVALAVNMVGQDIEYRLLIHHVISSFELRFLATLSHIDRGTHQAASTAALKTQQDYSNEAIDNLRNFNDARRWIGRYATLQQDGDART